MRDVTLSIRPADEILAGRCNMWVTWEQSTHGALLKIRCRKDPAHAGGHGSRDEH